MCSAIVKKKEVDPKLKCFLKFDEFESVVMDLGCTQIFCNFTTPSVPCRLKKMKLTKVQSDKNCVDEICNELKSHCLKNNWIYCPPKVTAPKTKTVLKKKI